MSEACETTSHIAQTLTMAANTLHKDIKKTPRFERHTNIIKQLEHSFQSHQEFADNLISIE